MLGAFLDWAVVLLPTVLSVVGVLVSLKAPHSKHHTRLRIGLIAFGLFVTGVTFWQQSRSRKAHAAEVEALSRNLNGIQSQATSLQQQVATLTAAQQTETARRQQAEKDLLIAMEATRQGVAEDIKKNPVKVSVSGTGVRSEQEKKQRQAVRTQLSLLMSEGRGIMNVCLRPPVPNLPCEKTAMTWYSKSLQYVTANMEPSYAARFMSATGPGMSWPGTTQETNNILWFLKNHADALDQFIKELLD